MTNMETSPINSLFDLSNRTAIVTGAGKGIGKSIALGLASAGANVVLCSRTPEDLEEVKLAIEGLGQEAFATPCDVTREEDIQRVVQETQQRYSSIDILVNNAGRTV